MSCKIIFFLSTSVCMSFSFFANASSEIDSARCVQYFSGASAEGRVSTSLEVNRQRDAFSASDVQLLLQKYQTTDLNEALIRSSFKNKWNQLQIRLWDVSVLLASGADITARQNDVHRMSALEHAISEGHFHLVKFLLYKNTAALINAENPKGETPLFLAVYGAQRNREGEGILKQVLAANAHLNHQNISGETALYQACAYSIPMAVKLLLQAGASMAIRSHTGLSAFDIAQTRRQPHIARWIQIFGDYKFQEIFERYKSGRDVDKALKASFIANNFVDANFLIRAGGEYTSAHESLESRKQTLLSRAVANSSDLNRLLQGNPINLNKLSRDGRTPLMKAIANASPQNANSTEFILFLLKIGAQPNIPNSEGVTAEVLAQRLGHSDLARLIRNYSSKN